MTDRLLTLDETAELVGVHRRTVEREIRRGRLEVVRIAAGRLVRVREAEARRWAGLPQTVIPSDYPPSSQNPS
jgi:excisionase family DNA binding protein